MNKFVITVFDLCDHIIQILKLMLVYFDHTQSLVIILVQDSFDAGRFASSRITEQQTVIGLSSSYKCLCIIDQFLLGGSSYPTRSSRFDMSDICDRYAHHNSMLWPSLPCVNTKCLSIPACLHRNLCKTVHLFSSSFLQYISILPLPDDFDVVFFF